MPGGGEIQSRTLIHARIEPEIVFVTRHALRGEPIAFAAGAAILGHPATAVVMLVNHLAARDAELPAGSLVLSGGTTEAVTVKAGDNVTVRVQHLGSVSLRFV